MKVYALPRVDGGVAIMRCSDDVKPEDEIAAWTPQDRAEITGDIHAIQDAPKDRKYREAWRVRGGAIEIDAAKKAEIDARPPVKTLGERVAELERRGAGT